MKMIYFPGIKKYLSLIFIVVLLVSLIAIANRAAIAAAVKAH